jgi:hypothetical protein
VAVGKCRHLPAVFPSVAPFFGGFLPTWLVGRCLGKPSSRLCLAVFFRLAFPGAGLFRFAGDWPMDFRKVRASLRSSDMSAA